jgi:hypothetical protein
MTDPFGVPEGPRDAGAAATSASRRAIVNSYPKFVDLGNGYTILYTDVNDPGSIVSTKSLGGEGGVSATSYYTQQQQNARDAASLAENQRQYDLTQGERKARGDQEQQLAEGQALGSFRGQATLGKQQLSENARQFDSSQALDYYKYLADQAANPRNFMENFFLRRGQGSPAGASAFGNNDAALRQFSGFAGQAAAPRAAAPASAYPTGPLSTPPTQSGGGYASPYEGLSGFGQNGMLRLAPNDPDAAGLMAKYPGRYEMTSPQEAAKYLPRFARGGTVTMNEPHALINLRTGQPVAIAGEAGMEHAHFDGAVIKGEDLSNIDPYSGYVNYESSPAGQAASNNYSSPTQNQTYPGAEPTPFDITSIQAPPGYHWSGNQLVQDPPPAITSPTATTATAPAYQAPPTNPYVAPPPPPLTTQPTSSLPIPDTKANAATSYYQNFINQPPPPPPPVGEPAPVIQPGFLPQGGQTSSGVIAPGALTPRDVAPPGTFGGISGSGGINGARPTFMPGEGQDTLQQLAQAGVVPPFIQRALAQSRGVQSQGTNQPNPFVLPKDVPLQSKLAWNQMTPDEQQAYLSYASSYGVTPEEYLAAVEAFAPHGGTTQLSPFGVPFQFTRQ